MRHTLALALALVLPALPGCYLDLGGDDWGGEPWPGSSAESALSTSGGQVNGEIGSRSVAGTADIRSAYEYGEGDYGHTYLELWGDTRRGAAMVGLTLNGLSIADLEPGDTITGSGVGSYASVMGCSGPSAGDWEYDVSTDDVTVQVEAGPSPDTLQLHFEAELPPSYSSTEPGTTVNGSVVVAR